SAAYGRRTSSSTTPRCASWPACGRRRRSGCGRCPASATPGCATTASASWRSSAPTAPSTPRPPTRARRPPPPRRPRPAPSGPRQAAAAGRFRAGASVEEVAGQMSLSRGTVFGYLEEHVRAERPRTLRPWVDDDTYYRVVEAARQVGTGRLKPIFLLLGEKVP